MYLNLHSTDGEKENSTFPTQVLSYALRLAAVSSQGEIILDLQLLLNASDKEAICSLFLQMLYCKTKGKHIITQTNTLNQEVHSYSIKQKMRVHTGTPEYLLSFYTFIQPNAETPLNSIRKTHAAEDH